MARRKRIHHIKPNSQDIVLDQFSLENIQKGKFFHESYRKYYWDYYQELAYQRSKIADKIRKSLIEASQKYFKIERWQRIIKYKYALEPLSMAGSLKDPGGRFNIGDIDVLQFPCFPALYLAPDKDTAIQEALSQPIIPKQNFPKIDPLDFALTRSDSIVVVSVSGSLGSIINLKDPGALQLFVDLIKNAMCKFSKRQ